jgi:hypothetical protein
MTICGNVCEARAGSIADTPGQQVRKTQCQCDYRHPDLPLPQGNEISFSALDTHHHVSRGDVKIPHA